MMATEMSTEILCTAAMDWLSRYMGHGIVITDRELRVRRWNRWMEIHSGLSEQDVMGRSLLEIYPDLADRRIDRIYRQVLRGQPAVLAHRFHHYLFPMAPTVSGTGLSHMPQSAQIAPLLDDAQRIIGTITVVEDVTERVLREQELLRQIEEQATLNQLLRESEERYRILTERSLIGVFLLQGQVFRYVNPAFCRISGYERDEIIGKRSPRDMIAAEDWPRVQEALQQLESGQIREAHLEFSGVRKDGQTRYVEGFAGAITIDGQPGVLGAILDITDRKVTEQALAESERRFREVLENVRLLAVMLDLDGRITFCNEYLLEVTGWDQQEILGRNWFDLFIPEGNVAREIWRTFVQEGRLQPHAENEIVTRDGRRRLISWNNTALRDPEGQVIGITSIGEDITERREAETERDRLIAELEAFAHTVAHDLKSPLGVILGYAEMLVAMDGSLGEAERAEALRAIAQTSQKMRSIIDELLLLAQVRRGDATPEPLEMGQIVAAAMQRVSRLIEEHQAEIVTPTLWPIAMGYGPWIEEVWVNYLSNAIKYGGRPPRVELGADELPNGMIRFWVRDNGPGIPEEQQQQLFQEFTRVGQIRRVEGHGLGLSIVKRIVERLGGEVGVESQIGKGSLFYFTLPAIDSERRRGL